MPTLKTAMSLKIRIRWIKQKKGDVFPYGVVWIVTVPEVIRDQVIEQYRKHVRDVGIGKEKEIFVRTLGHLMELIHITTRVALAIPAKPLTTRLSARAKALLEEVQ